ncbi:ATP-binding cassette domain-containing protein [Paraburkholderia sp. 32]|uniref:ATP-binding cassette domain-containing protein n=1 Tax=Paraburkholderia sp. 32 TaxID=2991057 RepID=UPI003D227F2A
MKGSNATVNTFAEPLRVRQLSHGFQSPDRSTVTIFDRLDFSVGHGEIVSIVGRSGAGKSTLFNLISGLLTPQSGEISVGRRGRWGSGPHRLYVAEGPDDAVAHSAAKRAARH